MPGRRIIFTRSSDIVIYKTVISQVPEQIRTRNWCYRQNERDSPTVAITQSLRHMTRILKLFQNKQ